MLHSLCFYFYVFYTAIAIREYTFHHFDVNEVLVVEIVDNEWLHVHCKVKFCLVPVLPCAVWSAGFPAQSTEPQLHCETGGVS